MRSRGPSTEWCPPASIFVSRTPSVRAIELARSCVWSTTKPVPKRRLRLSPSCCVWRDLYWYRGRRWRRVLRSGRASLSSLYRSSATTDRDCASRRATRRIAIRERAGEHVICYAADIRAAVVRCRRLQFYKLSLDCSSRGAYPLTMK